MPDQNYKRIVRPESFDEALNAATIKILRPLIRLLIRTSVPFRRLVDMIKWVYVDEARRDIEGAGDRASKSAVALKTGLCRKEVQRLIYEPEPPGILDEQSRGRVPRIISAWRHDWQYQDGNRQPAVLPLAGGAGSFQALVRQHGADVTYRVVLNELMSVGCVEVEDDHVRLVSAQHVPTAAHEMYSLMGKCVSHLTETVTHNILASESAQRRLQREIISYNIPAEAVAGLREELGQQWQDIWPRLLETIESFESKDPNSATHTLGVGFYYFSDDLTL